MSGSLKDLATYVAADRFRSRADPIQPENVVLESYTFLPYARTGVVAVLDRPFDWSLPARATARLAIPVVDGTGAEPAEVEITVRGPGDVTGIDERQVIRCYPRAGSSDALAEEVAHIEFDRPDLPWMFTPAGPTPDRRLVPWISLVVVPVPPGGAHPVRPGQRGGLSRLVTRRGELPSLSDAWAWAHAQVMGPRAAAQTIADRLSPVNATINLSRLLCPRKLQPSTSYVACVVPTFKAGVEAGLGLPVRTTTLEPAWADDADPDAEVVVPTYYWFTFATGEPLDFKLLAERLVPAPAPPGVGRRRLDTSRPGGGVSDVPSGLGRVMVVEGPVVSPGSVEDEPGWPDAADQSWPPAQHQALLDRINSAQAQAFAPSPEPHPVVGPPLYSGAQAARSAVDQNSPPWFAELNGDPRSRVVAGLGTRVVQHDQEPLMAESWNQVAGIETANAALRAAQLGRYVAASIHRRHLAPLPAPALVALTAGAHSRIRRPDEAVVRTVRAKLLLSSLPAGVTSAAFRRLMRPRGPVARFAAADIAARPVKVGALTCDTAELTRDYTRTYVNPDGIDDITAGARRVIGPGLVSHAWSFIGDHRVALDERARLLARPSVTDALVGGGIDHIDPSTVIRPSTAAAAVLTQLLMALPARDLIERDRSAAEVAATLMGQIAAVATHTDRVVIATPVAERALLAGHPTASERLEFTDWVSLVGAKAPGKLFSAEATGTLGGTIVSVTGHLQDLPGSRVDGTETFFSQPGFDPPLVFSDAIGLQARFAEHPDERTDDPKDRFVLAFSRPVIDPILYLGSVASMMRFEDGVRIEKLSGQDGFAVEGNTIHSTAVDADGRVVDKNGVVVLRGTFTTVSFTARTSFSLDGIYLQVAVRTTVLTTVDRPALDGLVDELREVTAHHELGEVYADPGAAADLSRLVSEWQQPEADTLIPGLKTVADRLVPIVGITEDPRDRIHVPDLRLPELLAPALTVARRIRGRLLTHPTWLRADWFDDQRIEPIMAGPRFDHPMYEALDRYDREWLIPGVADLPDPDVVTVLETNRRFVEAFLLGLNTELARELLWREYPTDGRGTYFRSFWTGQPELMQDVHEFGDTSLGEHVDPRFATKLVVLARGELIRRYPGLTAHAVRHASLTPEGRPVFGNGAATAKTLFQINLAPNLLLVGFDLTQAEVDAADAAPDDPIPASGAWWFTFAENPTEPRFGLDDADSAVLTPRDDVSWSALLAEGAPFLRPTPAHSILDGPAPPTPSPVPVIWGADAAAVAHILYNPPARAAFRAAPLLGKARGR